MIRRQEGDEWVLIRQDDHAMVAGALAASVGNGLFEPPHPRDVVIKAVGMHDEGWYLHDDNPTVNSKGEPIDVFESTRQIALPVWTASSEWAAAADPYAGLLVSMHGLSLSVFATSQATSKHEDLTPQTLQDRFAINQFQHREVERQEELRTALGIRNDIPLSYGVAKVGVDPAHDRLVANFRLLQAMDLLSLSICCTEPPAKETQDVYPVVGGKPVKLSLRREKPDLLVVDPWPFEGEKPWEFEVPCRRVPARPFESEVAFRAAYQAAPAGWVSLAIVPG